MHISLDQALGRQPRLNTLGDKLLQIAGGASAAYSLRSLTGNGGNAVKIRREFDNKEVNVAFDGSGVVSDTSPITNVTESPDQGDTTTTSLGAFITEDVLHYESDFTSGTNSYLTQTANVTLSAPSGAFNGEEDYLLATCSADATLFLQRNIAISSGDTYRVDFKVFIPTANDDNTPVLNNTGANSSDPVTVTKGSWQDVSITLAITVSTVRLPRIVFSMLAGEVLYFKDIKYTVTSGADASVVTWYDQSGNSNDATQDVAGDQPLIAQGGNLETDGLSFNGTSHSFNIPTNIISSIDSVSSFVVAELDETTGTRSALALSRNDPDKRYYNPALISGVLNFGYGTTATAISFGSADTSKHLFSATSGSSTTEVFLDGTSKGTVSSTSGLNVLTSGGISEINNSVRWSGNIQEIIIYASDQSSKRSDIETNIASHYDITLA